MSRNLSLLFLCCALSYPLRGMGQSDTLDVQDKISIMRELVVKASKILMVDKGDTIIYNADVLRLSSSSMLDELINSLPNTTIDADGQIYVNGNLVNELLIEGRDFFHGEPDIALRNLPAYTVHKIKVYRKAPRDAYLTRGRDSVRALETDPLVMDVRLKAKYQNGIIANAEAGGSVPLKEDDSFRYLGRIFGLEYNKVRSISAHANANNINDTGKPRGRGIWNPAVSNNGLERNVLGGFNYTYTRPEDQLAINSDLRITQRKQELQSRQSSMTYLTDGDLYASSRTDVVGRMLSGEWSGDIFYPGRTFTMQVTPHIVLSKGNSEQVSQSASFGKRISEAGLCDVLDTLFDHMASSQQIASSMVEKQIREMESDSRNLNVGANASFNLKPSFLPRVLRIALNGNYQSSSSTEDSWQRIGYAAPEQEDYSRRLHGRLPMNIFTYALNVQYQLMSFQHKKQKGEVNLAYTLSGNRTDRERQLCYLDVPYEDGDWWKDEGGGMYMQDTGLWLDDTDNSYLTTEQELVQRIMLTGSYSFTDKKTLSISVPCTFKNESVDDERGGVPLSLSRANVLWDPSCSFRWSAFSLGYRFSERMPGLFNLLNRRDNSNPMVVNIGNANLKVQKNHIPFVQYNKRFARRQSSLTVRAEYQYVQDKLKRMNYWNLKTGITTIQERNVNGDWLTSLNVSYQSFLDKKKRWNLSSTASCSYGKEGEFESQADDNGPSLRTSDHLLLNENLSLSYNYKNWRAGLNGTGKWQHSERGQSYFRTFDYVSTQVGVFVKTPVFNKFSFDSDLTQYLNWGGFGNTADQKFLIWNLKGNWDYSGKLSVQLEAVDILRQLKSVNAGSGTLGWSETWTNTRPSFVMIHILYRFDFLPRS